MVQLVAAARLRGGQRLRGEVHGGPAVLQPVEQQARHAAGDGRGLLGARQLRQGQPIAAQALLCAEVDGVGEGAETADEVEVGRAEGAGEVVLLPHAEEREEL